MTPKRPTPDRSVATSVVLPWPPSVNHYWRHSKGRIYITPEGQAFRQTVLASYLGHPPFEQRRIGMELQVIEPDRRRRDADNLLKAPLDALQHASAFHDDSQIRDLRIWFAGFDKGKGRLIVRIWTL